MDLLEDRISFLFLSAPAPHSYIRVRKTDPFHSLNGMSIHRYHIKLDAPYHQHLIYPSRNIIDLGQPDRRRDLTFPSLILPCTIPVA